MQNASASNATKFQEKRITPLRDTYVWSFNTAFCENSFCEGWHLLLCRVYLDWRITFFTNSWKCTEHTLIGFSKSVLLQCKKKICVTADGMPLIYKKMLKNFTCTRFASDWHVYTCVIDIFCFFPIMGQSNNKRIVFLNTSVYHSQSRYKHTLRYVHTMPCSTVRQGRTANVAPCRKYMWTLRRLGCSMPFWFCAA